MKLLKTTLVISALLFSTSGMAIDKTAAGAVAHSLRFSEHGPVKRRGSGRLKKTLLREGHAGSFVEIQIF